MSEIPPKIDVPPQLTSEENSLLKDFYWSFYHSQGVPRLQTYLSVSIARQTTPKGLEDLDSVEKRGESAVMRMTLPSTHPKEAFDKDLERVLPLAQGGKGDANALEGFRESWRTQMKALRRAFEDKPNNPDPFGMAGAIYRINLLSEMQLAAVIALEIMTADLLYSGVDPKTKEYTEKKREHNKDPHESFLRSYGFLAYPAQTPRFAFLYQDIVKVLYMLGVPQSLIKGRRLVSPQELSQRGERIGLRKEDAISVAAQFQNLVDEWEIKHHGQRFLTAFGTAS